MIVTSFFHPLNLNPMAKTKKVAEKATTTAAVNSSEGATKQAANYSPAPAEKAPAKKAKAEPKPETRKVCFTDQDTGKRWCGEVTEVPKKETPTPKVAGGRRRKRDNRA